MVLDGKSSSSLKLEVITRIQPWFQSMIFDIMENIAVPKRELQLWDARYAPHTANGSESAGAVSDDEVFFTLPWLRSLARTCRTLLLRCIEMR